MRISDWSSDVCSSDLGIQTITSESEDGESSINIEFSPTRDVDSAANDVRDRVSGAVDDLPEEALAPELRTVDADARPIMFFIISQPGWARLQLSAYVDRNIPYPLSSIDAFVRVFFGCEAPP